MNDLILLISAIGCIAGAFLDRLGNAMVYCALACDGIIGGMEYIETGHPYIQGNFIVLASTVAFAVYWKRARSILVPEYWSRRERRALAQLFPASYPILSKQFWFTSPAQRYPHV